MPAIRISVSIPEDLHAAIEKHREQINVSRICQGALRREIAMLDHVATDVLEGEEIEALIERLRSEKEEFTKQWRPVGFGDGVRAAKRMRFEHLEYWAWAAQGRQSEFDDHKPFWQNQLQEVYEEAMLNAEGGEGTPWDWRSYLEGWLEGVKAVWDAVKDKV